MNSKQQDFSHNRKEEDCFVRLQPIQPLAVKILHTDILNKSGQVTLKNVISLYNRNEMKWADMKANYAQLLMLLLLLNSFLLTVAGFCLQIMQKNEFLCDTRVRLSPLPSIPISCEWNMWRGTFISHGLGSHNLIHLYDKLHYEGSQ